jgi:hypothetical protein
MGSKLFDSTSGWEQTMKGMLDFLEKAGLVKRDEPAASTEAEINLTIADPDAPPPASAAPSSPAPASASPAASVATALNLDDIYAAHGVGPALYPAERLLRLVDGLSAMDDATRLMAIKAMDAADESWTINDPLADAAAKLQALAAHGQAITANLQQLEQQTQAHLDAVAQRQDKVVGDIRQQIAELEGLVARELSRSAQETATQQANLQAARDQIARDLAEVAQVSQRLQSLSSQFGASNTNPKE